MDARPIVEIGWFDDPKVTVAGCKLVVPERLVFHVLKCFHLFDEFGFVLRQCEGLRVKVVVVWELCSIHCVGGPKGVLVA